MVSWIISVTGIFMPDSDGTVQGATGKKTYRVVSTRDYGLSARICRGDEGKYWG